MNGYAIKPQESIVVLGAIPDNRLTWEEHNAESAGKTRGIARSIARDTKSVRRSDRVKLIQALAHSKLEFARRISFCLDYRQCIGFWQCVTKNACLPNRWNNSCINTTISLLHMHRAWQMLTGFGSLSLFLVPINIWPFAFRQMCI